jgi:hypothetical protein
MNAAIDQAPRHHAEALRIEIPQVNHVNAHATNLARCTAPMRVE